MQCSFSTVCLLLLLDPNRTSAGQTGKPLLGALSGVGLSILDNLTCLEESRLHHGHAGFELTFGRAFEQFIDSFLHLLADLLLSTFLAYHARNILDFHEVGL
jgi:hypothetical protein